MRQRSLLTDKNDESSFLHDRRSGMNLNSEFKQHIPMFFSREGAEINLSGQFKGSSAFLICNGPSFVKLNRDLLNLPGIMTLGVNNGAKTFRPNFWICVDDPSRFLKSIWLDPKIIKFIPQAHFEKTIFDNEKWEPTNIKTGECPNVIGYRRNEKFVASRFLEETHLNWGNSKENGGGRSVMLPALRILFILGFRKVYLLGCDFKMSDTYAYHFDETRGSGAVNCNNSTYDRLKEEYLPQLKPYFDQEGFQIFNCNPDSNLKVFPFISFDDAIKEATSKLGDIPNERVWGLYSNPEEKPQWKQEIGVEQKPHLETLQKLKNGEEVIVPPRIPKQPKVTHSIIPANSIPLISSINNNTVVMEAKKAKALGDMRLEQDMEFSHKVDNIQEVCDKESVKVTNYLEKRNNPPNPIPSLPPQMPTMPPRTVILPQHPIMPQTQPNNQLYDRQQINPQTSTCHLETKSNQIFMDSEKLPLNNHVKWNPYNKVVLDHRNGSIDIPYTNAERARRGLVIPWTPEIGEKEIKEAPIQ